METQAQLTPYEIFLNERDGRWTLQDLSQQKENFELSKIYQKTEQAVAIEMFK